MHFKCIFKDFIINYGFVRNVWSILEERAKREFCVTEENRFTQLFDIKRNKTYTYSFVRCVAF